MTAPHQQFLTETRERFIKALLAELPAERIRELYLFQPIRQGGVESGVAVVAAYQGGLQGEAGPSSGDGGRETGVQREVSSDVAPLDIEDVTGAASCAVSFAIDGEVPEDSGEAGAPDSGSPVPSPPTPDQRYTVYTARYRHTLKGPDRGKWESSIVAEADAPLLSIESVVRGVQRRSGDVDPPDHMSATELRAALRLDGEGAA